MVLLRRTLVKSDVTTNKKNDYLDQIVWVKFCEFYWLPQKNPVYSFCVSELSNLTKNCPVSKCGVLYPIMGLKLGILSNFV